MRVNTTTEQQSTTDAGNKTTVTRRTSQDAGFINPTNYQAEKDAIETAVACVLNNRNVDDGPVVSLYVSIEHEAAR